MLLSIIIVNYNQEKYLKECISSIKKYMSCEYEIIVINNSEEIVNAEGITLVNSLNKGFSSANNQGAEMANGEYLFFLNPDTVLTKDFSINLFNDLRGIKFGAVGLGLCYRDMSFQLSFGLDNTFLGEIGNKKSELGVKNKSVGIIKHFKEEYNKLKEVDWVSGAAMLVRKEDFIKTGMFDDRYFLYYEDADLCYRFKSTGYKNYYYPFADIIHFKGENTRSDFYTGTYYHAKESQMIYYRKHNGYFQYLFLRLYLLSRFSVKYLITRDRSISGIISLIIKGVKLK